MAISRYNFMKSGVVKDEILNDYYPDPLSLNYQELELNEVPSADKLTDEKIITFWDEVRRFYGVPYLDDMVLTLNGVSHKNFLQSDQIVYFPSVESITSSFSKER